MAVLAIVTMVVGNLGALAQTSLKRMLAYSSIAHAGYMLTRVRRPRPSSQGEAVLFYLVAYAAVNLGAFGVARRPARGRAGAAPVHGPLGPRRRRPALAAALTVFLVSLTGMPITAGFVGKFYLFNAAVSVGCGVALAVVGVLMSVVSAYYYLRVVVAMYMREPEGEDTWGAGLPGLGLRAGRLGRAHAAPRRVARAAARRRPRRRPQPDSVRRPPAA